MRFLIFHKYFWLRCTRFLISYRYFQRFLTSDLPLDLCICKFYSPVACNKQNPENRDLEDPVVDSKPQKAYIVVQHGVRPVKYHVHSVKVYHESCNYEVCECQRQNEVVCGTLKGFHLVNKLNRYVESFSREGGRRDSISERVKKSSGQSWLLL